MFVCSPLSLPYVNWASQEGCLLCLRFSLWFSDFLLFHFYGFFSFLCVLPTTILDSVFPFWLPNIWILNLFFWWIWLNAYQSFLLLEKHFLVPWIFSVVFVFISVLFISSLVFIISFIMLILGFVCSSLSNILAWKIPWREKPHRRQSMGSQRAGHDWATSFYFPLFFIYYLQMSSYTVYLSFSAFLRHCYTIYL